MIDHVRAGKSRPLPCEARILRIIAVLSTNFYQAPHKGLTTQPRREVVIGLGHDCANGVCREDAASIDFDTGFLDNLVPLSGIGFDNGRKLLGRGADGLNPGG